MKKVPVEASTEHSFRACAAPDRRASPHRYFAARVSFLSFVESNYRCYRPARPRLYASPLPRADSASAYHCYAAPGRMVLIDWGDRSPAGDHAGRGDRAPLRPGPPTEGPDYRSTVGGQQDRHNLRIPGGLARHDGAAADAVTRLHDDGELSRSVWIPHFFAKLIEALAVVYLADWDVRNCPFFLGALKCLRL